MFVHVGTLDELWDGEMAARTAGGRKIVLIRIGDDVRAYEDRCVHLGVPLSDGTLEGGVLTCSAHHYQYDARCGLGLNPRGLCLVSFPVRVDAGQVFVDVAATEKERSA